MLAFVRAGITAALIALFVTIGGGSLAGDAQPARHRPPQQGRTAPGSTATFTATAYCQRGTTRSGTHTRAGIAAADPGELPVGSVVQIDADLQKYTGIYTVLDTGSKVQGRHVDLFMHNCAEATHFGRQPVKITVLRKGWNPKGSAPKRVLANSVGR